ncbi:F-box only protein 31-like isoform X1 [Macrobrachium rosenbergii]|uniref:F-box only protein 31-like isoform X1 n=2 Tax=Macrobrachium rosenbergii TaxID=79674 RepID=UPI0034D46CDB
MSLFTLDNLPECVILEILKRCKGEDLAAVSLTCTTLYSVTSIDSLWKHICQRELRQDVVDLGSVKSYRMLYANLLHKYKSILGVYQIEWDHYGSLLEIKYDAGNIKGISMEGTVEEGKIFDDLREEVLFTIKGDTYPPELICLPDIDPHSLTISFDQATGKLESRCKNSLRHLKAFLCRLEQEANIRDGDGEEFSFQRLRGFMKLRYLKEQLENDKPMISVPLILPCADDVPATLRKSDGTLPSQIITPGLFKGDYSAHGVELILFKYISENELHGYKVTGDRNVSAGKISLKCFLDYPVNPTLEEQKSMESLQNMPKVKRTGPVHELPKQRFKIPDQVYGAQESSAVHVLDHCFARYHGECQVAYDNYQHPSFIQAHFVVFNDNLIGEVLFDLECVSLYARVERSFQPRLCQDVKSVF